MISRRQRGAVFGDPNAYEHLRQKLAGSAFKAVQIDDNVLAMMTTGLSYELMFESATGMTTTEYFRRKSGLICTQEQVEFRPNRALIALAESLYRRN